MTPDWTRTDDYRFTERLSAGQWAWEFLRRNPDYRREWTAFWQTWQQLEAAHGKPPDRDFQAWKADPRAYVLADEDSGDGCRVDQDKVLIECAMGARWGFYKFPLDPATDQPEMGTRLSWREQPRPVNRLRAGDEAFLSGPEHQVALGFDLRLPLREQLEEAKRYLVVTQSRLKKAGMPMRTVAALRGQWTRQLRLLDGESSGADADTLRYVLSLAPEQWSRERDEALRLRDGAYLELLSIPER